MHLSNLQLTDFRNYSSLALSIAPQGALFYGNNGSGKTNLLEAVHVLCLGRSHRNVRKSDLIRSTAPCAHISGSFSAADQTVAPIEASIGFGRDKSLVLKRNGTKIPSLSEWFSQGAVVPFGPEDVGLVQGAPAQRRRFLDMLICQIDPGYMHHLATYVRLLAQRNKTLQSIADPILLDSIDEQMVEPAGDLFEKRCEIIELCKGIFSELYSEMSGGTEQGSLRFDPCVSLPKNGAQPWPEVFYNTLKNNRKRDLELGYSSCGPHRDSLQFFVNGKPSRTYASQGQCRSLALALRLSSVRCIEMYRKEPMIFLVDDAFSELDDNRIDRVYPLIKTRGQVLITSPTQRYPFVVDSPVFCIEQGTIKPA